MKSIIKKLSKFITSRMLYLFLGLFFSLAIFVVHAAWNSKVNSGDTLTSTLWNDVVDKLVELDERAIPSGFCIFSDIQTSCHSGWTRRSSFDARTIRGASSPGGTGGSGSHIHSINSSSGGVSSSDCGDCTWCDCPDAVYSVNSNTGSSSSWPPYKNVLICCKD